MILARSRTVSAALAIAAAVLLISPAPLAIAGDLFVVVATDDDAPTIGVHMAKNSKRVTNLIKRNVPRARCQILKIRPENLTADNVLRSIAGLGAGQDDAILFFYSGHGAYDERQRQTYLILSQDREHVVFVGQIQNAIKAKGVRFGAAVADCCNCVRPVLARFPVAPGDPPDEGAPEISPVFKTLFFESRGSLLIESSAPREYAIVLPTMKFRDRANRTTDFHFGSLFTQRFCDALENTDGGNEQPLDWSRICRDTQEQMDAEFPDICPRGVITLFDGRKVSQKQQTVTAWRDDQAISTR